MTKEEAIKAIEEYLATADEAGHIFPIKFLTALDVVISALKDEWIPVTERLPEEGKDVLFCDIDNDIMLGYHLTYAPATHFIDKSTWDDVKNVRAWMELPESYKETKMVEPQKSKGIDLTEFKEILLHPDRYSNKKGE